MKNIINRFILISVSFLYSTVLIADTQVALKESDPTSKKILKEPIGSAEFIQVFLGLLFVLASIVLVVWLMKKLSKVNLARNEHLKIITAINLGAREKILVVQVGEQQLLIGATSQTINLLQVLENPIEISKSPEIFSTALADKIKSALNKRDEKNEKT